VDRAGAPGAEERVVARIAPALGDVYPRGARHALVDDVVDAHATESNGRRTVSASRVSARRAAATSIAIVPPAK